MSEIRDETALPPPVPHVLLVDEPDRSGRSTATLLASLAGRLAVLHGMTGADVIGAITAGYAALGRQAAQTSDGRRMLDAIEASRAGTNGDRLWDALLIGKWASSLPPTAVLDQLRNDLALLAAPDLEETLELPPMPAEPHGTTGRNDGAPATAAHYLLGAWTYSRELVATVEALVGDTKDQGRVVSVPQLPDLDGPLLP